MRGLVLIGTLAAFGLGCGPSKGSSIGGGGGGAGGGNDGGGGGGACVPSAEVCDGKDNDCDKEVDEGFDVDGDSYTSCASDCDDSDPAVNPGATEVANSKDDNCDGKVDNRLAGKDFDKDGVPYPTDCNDDEPLVGQYAIEVPGDNVDNNCNGQVDEPAQSCDDAAAGVTAPDFAKVMGMCDFVYGASFANGDARARAIRTQFGTTWNPKQGTKMVALSTGLPTDNITTPTYEPQPGSNFGGSAPHPLYAAPRCGALGNCPIGICLSNAQCINGKCVPYARDVSELKLTLRVPQNARSFSFQFNFFSAEYPEFVCRQFNDRFIVLLESSAIDKTKLPNQGANQCLSGTGTPNCNISYDANDQPITVNNGFFAVCKSAGSNQCTQPITLLEKTGFDRPDSASGTGQVAGGATGWLTTKAPAKPGETVTLRFIIFDEGDGILDSTVLIDNFRWDVTPVVAPETSGGIN